MYLPNHKYRKLVKALLNLEPCHVSGKITKDQVTIALSEVGNIWPASIVASEALVQMTADEKAADDRGHSELCEFLAEMEMAQTPPGYDRFLRENGLD